MQDIDFLEPSEEKVKSISLILSEKTFLLPFSPSTLHEFYLYSILFQFLKKIILTFFSTILKTKPLFSCHFLTPNTLYTASQQVFEEQHKILYLLYKHQAISSNTSDWEVVCLHT